MTLLDAKSIFFYPGLILSLGWTLMNFARIFSYVSELKAETPSCTASNPNRLLISAVTVIAMALGKLPLERASSAFF